MSRAGLLQEAARAYTEAVLAFELDEAEPAPAEPLSADALSSHVDRALRLAEKRAVRAVILLGAGNGRFALELAQRSPVPVLASELSPARARRVLARNETFQSHGPALLADISPWAHLMVWSLAGLTPRNALVMLNPETPPTARAELQALQRTFAGSRILEIDPATAPPADIALAAMLHPDEPNLAGFFAGLPRSAREAALLWDAQAPPEDVPDCPLPLRQAAHPLGNDFSAQRNRMMDLAGSDWIFYLDADERIPPELDAWLPALAGLPDIHGVHFPRLTLYPDNGSFKAGYGLWPDLQLRLFRRGPGVRFERPIHEKIEGLPGRQAVLLDASIQHLSRLLKRPDQIEAKLARFNASGGARHMLNQDYPSLPLSWIVGLQRPGSPRVLVA